QVTEEVPSSAPAAGAESPQVSQTPPSPYPTPSSMHSRPSEIDYRAPQQRVGAGASTSSMQQQQRYKAAPAVQEVAAPRCDQVDTQRKKLDELFGADRCDEAIRLFQEVEKSPWRVTATERARYVRCLARVGRVQDAENELNALRIEKAATNTEI